MAGDPAKPALRIAVRHNLSAGMDQFRMGALASNRSPKTMNKTPVQAMPASDPREDEVLLVAVGNHQDRRAFNALFHRFSGRIFALGMKITRNEQLANDLVQEAMLIVWQKAPLYDLDKGSAQTWIFTLVRNRCFDMLRKLKRQPDSLGSEDIWPLENDPELSEDPEQQRAAEIQIAQIEKHYNDLPDAQRIVIEQVFIHDLTHQEAAQKLDIPLGTLKSRLRLALNKLRQSIGVEQ